MAYEEILSYDPNQWSSGQPITSTKMNRIESGVGYAVNWVNEYRSQANDMQTASADMRTATAAVEAMRISMNTINSTVESDHKNIFDLRTKIDADTLQVYDSLLDLGLAYKARIATLESAASNHSTRLETLEGTVNESHAATLLDHTNRLATLTDSNSAQDTTIQLIGAELGLTYNSETHLWSSNNSRIDALEDTVNSLTGTEQGQGIIASIQAAINEINSTLSNASTGLAATKTIADRADNNATSANAKIGSGFDATNTVAAALAALETALATKANNSDVATALNGKVSTTDFNTLTTRVNGIGITIIVPSDKVTFNEEGIPVSFANTIEIAEKNDYLIQSASDNKYYYWKPIKVSDNPVTYEWYLISGGGSGSGNNNAEIYANHAAFAIADYDVNKDYYVLESDNVYHHYRYIAGENNTFEQIEIGQPVSTNNIKTYNIAIREEEVPVENSDPVTKNYLYLFELAYGDNNVLSDTDIDDLISANTYLKKIELPATGGGGGYASNTMKITRISPRNLTTAYHSESPTLLQFFFTSGEENELANYTLNIDGTDVLSNVSIRSGDPANKSNTWPSGTPALGFYSIDVSEYCTELKTYHITLTIASDENASITATSSWDVRVIEFYLNSSSPEGQIIPTNESVTINYTPFGAIEKTLHIQIDNDELHETTILLPASANGRETSCTIPTQNHGAHTIKLYMTADINGATIPTEAITRRYIWYDAENESSPIIIASKYSEYTSSHRLEVQAYTDLIIPYSVYNKNDDTYNVSYYSNYGEENEKLLDTIELEGNTSTSFTYAPVTALSSEAQTVTIKVGEVTLTIYLTVKGITQDVSPISGAIIDFDPATLTNHSVNREPTWTYNNQTYKLQASDNFNWSENINGGGYKEDADGKCFVIKAGTYVDLTNYQMFSGNVFDTGAEMKIIFKTKAVRDANAIWFSNVANVSNKAVGIQLGAHYGWLKTDKAVNEDVSTASIYDAWTPGTSYALNALVVYDEIIYKCLEAHTSVASSLKDEDEDAWDDYWKEKWLKMGKIETTTLATNSYLYFPYSENDRIELDININAYDAAAKNNFIMSYEDGVPSKAYAYSYGSGGDGLTQNATIRIGSADCDIYIYRLRIYNQSLTTADILQNFIADGATVQEKIKRYDRNCIYWDGYQYSTVPSVTATLDPIKLAEQMPGVKILMLDTPVFTTGKKDFIRNSTLRCIETTKNSNGELVYSDLNNWFFQNGYHAGQGTTSDNYGQAGRNVDFLFECDGTHAPTKAKNLNKIDGVYDYVNYVSSVLKGNNKSYFDTADKTWKPAANTNPITCLDWKDDDTWKSNTSYAKDAIVRINGAIYKCKISHTSGDTYNALNWEITTVNDWVAETEYTEGDLVKSSGDIYECTTAHTSGEIFEDTNWELKDSDTWTSNTEYNVGDKVIIDSVVYQCVLAHTSGNEFNAPNWELATGDHDCKIQLTSTSVPNNYFNLKVNIASSENVNNALFQKRYNDFLPYASPANAAQRAKYGYSNNIKVKNTMEFVPAVLFIRENNPDTSKHTEFNDTNWHFYALGNLGDSKKSDYTRAYDPNDMNEFTVENSDNNTNNGQFQSGVFMYNNTRAIETPYEGWVNNKAYEQGATVVYNGKIYIRSGATQAALAQNATYEWVAADWTEATLTGWTGETAPYFAPCTMPNPMQYLYPISSEEWNVKVGTKYANYKHHTLTTEKFDGDHSFEFRYACKGDYRDGDLINDTNGTSTVMENGSYLSNDKLQEKLNHDAFLAFYEWVITATPREFIDEATTWFVPEAMEFFYAFTHYYTMMDNRAKNTFWHFAKTGKYRKVTKPVASLLHVYEEATGEVTKNTSDSNDDNWWTGTFTPTTDSTINNEKTYYTQYAFDLWVYDTDTAAGIDNNGALVFPYGKEDTDYRTEGDANSGYAFNGAGSIFWRRLSAPTNEGGFADAITSIMKEVNKSCFDAQDLIDEFDAFQDYFPEEIWRLDIERKYMRTFTGLSYDNNSSITLGKQNPRFLTSMMQGRKKYQRRQWIRDQSVYFNSKYRLPDITANSNTIEFNCTTPADITNIAVTPSYQLKLTPYQDMYLNVQVGNGNYKDSIRAKAGQEYTYDLSGNYQETRIYINGANHLSGIGNLAPMYPYSLDLRALDHLKNFDMGTDEVGYTNTKLAEVGLTIAENTPLLESFNIKNCHSLGGKINLANANNLRTFEAEGTGITGITLPDYSNIETLHLPTTVNDIRLHGARYLKDFYIKNVAGEIDYSYLTKLDIHDSDYSVDYKENPSDALPVDWISIATEALSDLTLLKLEKLYSATINNINELEKFKVKRDNATTPSSINLTGTINVTGDWSQVEKTLYEQEWDNELHLNTVAENESVKYPVIYKYNDYDDGTGNIISGEEIMTLYITSGNQAPDIYADGTIAKPERASTVSANYTFGSYDTLSAGSPYIPYSGWKLENTSQALAAGPIITSRTVIETYFNETVRRYPIKWYLYRNDPTSLIKTSIAVKYGEGEDVAAPTVADIHAAGKETCSVSITGGQVTYSIFEGWERLPININPNVTDSTFNIYATWRTGTTSITEMFNDNNISNLTPEQLLVLSAMDSSTRTTYGIDSKIGLNTRINYTMGYDSIEQPTVTPVDSVLRLDGAIDRSFTTNIQPLKSGNDAFTFVIDYCFNPNATYNTNYAMLAGCYYSNTSTNVRNGFGIYYEKETANNSERAGVRVGFGDMFNFGDQSIKICSPDNMDLRNIIVLRHPANSTDLYIYSGAGKFDSESTYRENNIPVEVQITSIRQLNYNSDAYLTFGRLLSSAAAEDANDGTPERVSNAKGTIYSAKYWNKDLGDGECMQLATWPHEQMTYAIAYMGANRTQTNLNTLNRVVMAQVNDYPIPALKLATMSTSSHGRYYQARAVRMGADTNYSYSYLNSYLHTICNERIYNGLPVILQSILCKARISSTKALCTEGQQGSYSYSMMDSNDISRDYVELYSAANVLTDGSIYESEDNLKVGDINYLSPFSWYNSSNVTSYQFTNNRWVVNNSDTSRAEYLNIRCPNKALMWTINDKLRVFRETTSAVASSTSVAETIRSSTGTLKSGDIYIAENEATYMYVTSSEIQALGIQYMPSDNNNVTFASDSELTGGWIKADEYWVRSIIVSSGGVNLSYVYNYGKPNINVTNSAAQTGYKFNYLLSI